MNHNQAHLTSPTEKSSRPQVASAPRQIAVRDLGAGATALQVATGQAAGNTYQGPPAQSDNTLYGGKHAGERYQGTRRVSG